MLGWEYRVIGEGWDGELFLYFFLFCWKVVLFSDLLGVKMVDGIGCVILGG